MGRGVSTFRLRAWIGISCAGFVLALLVPAVASAANTASFSSVTPKSGSWSMSTRPTLSVVVYDRYGARRSGVSMTLDGHKVSASCTYIVRGSWNPRHPDYRRFKLRYAVPTPLRVGSHTVTVKVRDQRKRSSTYTWKFTVESDDPPADFDDLAPAKDSSSTSTRPLISVYTYDPYGVKGTGSYAMSIDGATVRPSIKYTKSGDYRRFRLSYQTTAALAPGAHSVTVSVEDLHHHDSYALAC